MAILGGEKHGGLWVLRAAEFVFASDIQSGDPLAIGKLQVIGVGGD